MTKLSIRSFRPISKRAKVQSDKPAYTKKEKTEKGYVWHYGPEHVKKRWKEKKDKMKVLEKNLQKVRKKYQDDLTSDDEKTRAIAAIVGIMDDTAMRIGNEDSAKEGTYGATTLKVKHVKGGSGNVTFDFPGKGAIEQNVVLKNNKVIKVVRDLMKGKKKDDFIFEIDGKKIWDRTVNRYLKEFGISAKDLRGFHANRLMKEQLKSKDFKEALKEVAEIVGHEEATLKNQYLDPELVAKHEKKDKDDGKDNKDKGKKDDKKKKKASISKRSIDSFVSQQTPTVKKTIEDLFHKPEFGPDAQTLEQKPDPLSATQQQTDVEQPIPVDPETRAMLTKNVNNVKVDISNYPDLINAWGILAPFLPYGARLTSGWRSDNKQAEIILEYWLSAYWPNKRERWALNKGFFHNKFPVQDTAVLRWWLGLARGTEPVVGRRYRQLSRAVEPLRKKMTSYVPDGSENEPPVALKIARMGTSKHLSGQAFDVSGAPIRAIVRAAQHVGAVLGDYVRFTKVVKEKGQDAVHIEIAPGVRVPDDHTMAAALRQYPPAKVASISKRAELNKEDLNWVKSIKPSISGRRTPGTTIFHASTSHEVVDLDQETRKKLRVGKHTKLSPTVLAAWQTLKPFVPSTVRVTSGSRNAESQKKILRNYWKSRTGQDIPKEYWDDIRMWKQISKLLRRHHGLIVGPPVYNPKVKYSHGKGNAFDVSGGDLYQIRDAVRMVSKDPRIPVKLRALVETANNAVHISVVSARYDEGAVIAVLNEQRQHGIYASAQKEEPVANICDMHEDLLESNPPENVVNAFEDAFGMQVCAAESWFDEMGFGLEDMQGDWFEKSPMFRHREEEDVPEYDIHDVDEAEARKLAKEEPVKFFYRGLHKEYKDLEAEALGNLIEDNAKFFFIFRYHEREEDAFKNMVEKAAELLSQQDVRAFFYYHLHHKFPELGRGAIVQLIDTNPDSFFDFGLQKDYPDLEESAGAARNIKDPNKMELEQPEWMKNEPENPISIRDKNASIYDLSANKPVFSIRGAPDGQ